MIQWGYSFPHPRLSHSCLLWWRLANRFRTVVWREVKYWVVFFTLLLPQHIQACYCVMLNVTWT